ncbi:MAG: hypothetical protein WC856_24255 [Methylococcaceae bacterium]|jgi:hypothetical protein
MAKEREALNLDDTIDLEELTQKRPLPKHIGKAEIKEIATQTGFISRQPRKKRSRTKYTAQLNIKVREGIKPLFQEIGAHLETFDNETFELALLALIEKEGTKEYLALFKELAK